jgi:ABC-type transport system involved in multi-copper enzyme maturation permease subunit
VLVVLTNAFFALFFAFRGNIPPSGTRFLYWPDGLVYALGYASGYASWTSYGTYVLIVIVGVVTAQEYAWRTLQVWLGHGVPRPLLLGAKLVVAAGVALLVALVCLVTTGALSAVFSVVVQGHVDAARVEVPQLVLSYIRTVYSMLPYAALTLLLVVVSRSAVVAVGGAIAIIAVLETTLTNVLPLMGDAAARAVQYLPAGLAAALNAGNVALAGGTPAPSALRPDPAAAVVGIAIYTLVFGGAAFWLFIRQDLAS